MNTRYTHRALERDVEDLNRSLEALGSDNRFVVGAAYNCSQVDIATVEQVARHCSDRQIESGSPRECIAKCRSYFQTICAGLKNLPVEITEEEEERRGTEIARVLNMKTVKGLLHNGKVAYDTTHGTKTAVGLFRTLQELIQNGPR